MKKRGVFPAPLTFSYEDYTVAITYKKWGVQITAYRTKLDFVYYRSFRHKVVNGRSVFKPMSVMVRYFLISATKKQKGWIHWEKQRIYEQRLRSLLESQLLAQQAALSSPETDGFLPQPMTAMD